MRRRTTCRLAAGLILALLAAWSSAGGAAEPRSGVVYPNPEYWYDSFNPERFGPNPNMFSDPYYDYPRANPRVTQRFGPPAYRFNWGYFGAQPRRQARQHNNYRGHQKSWQYTVSPGK